MQSEMNLKVRQRFSQLSIRKGAIVTILWCLLAIVPVLIVDLNFSELKTEITVFYLSFLVPLAIYLYVIQKYDLSATAIFYDPVKKLTDLWLFIPLILSTIGFIWIGILLLHSLSPEMATNYLDWLGSAELFSITEETTVLQYLLIFFLISLLGPLVEEIIFRGVMVERLGAKYGYMKGVVISSVIFGMLHVDFVGAFIFGVVLSVVYLKSRSLLIPFLIHAVNNGSAMIFYFYEDFFAGETWETTAPYLENAWIGIALFVVSVAWLIWYVREHWQIIHKREPFSLNAEV